MRHTSLQWIAGIAVLFVVSVGLTQAWAGWVTLAWDAPAPATALAGYQLSVQDSAGGDQLLDVGNRTTYPLTGLTGGLIYTLRVRALDTAGNKSNYSNTLTVPVPLAQPDTAFTPVGTPIAIDVLYNDIDPDPLGRALQIKTVTQGNAGGTVTSSSTSVTYTPPPDFDGTDSFTYTITNKPGAFAEGTVTVTVTSVTVPPVNQPPLAGADAALTPAGTPVTLTVLTNDTDPEGNLLTITAVTHGKHGTVTFLPQGRTVTYTPDPAFFGKDSFTYTISDGLGASAEGTVTITVFLPLEAEAGTLQAPMQAGTDTATPAVQYVWAPSSAPNIWDPMQTGGVSHYPFTVSQPGEYVVWGLVSPSTTETVLDPMQSSFFLGLEAPPDNRLITGISPAYSQVATLSLGSRYYIDTTATITAPLPCGWYGLGIIKTANADKRNKQNKYLTFTLWQDTTLYVAYDASVSAPSWLKTSFTNTGQRLQTTNGPLALWRRDYHPGQAGQVEVVLPGNRYQMTGSVRSQYVVLLAFHGPVPYLVWEWDVTPPPGASTSPQAWHWNQAGIDTEPVFWLDPGPHTLTVCQRKSGTKLDKLLITNNLDWVPQN